MKSLALFVPLALVAEVAIEQTPDGVRFGVVTPKPSGRAPTVFFFAGSAEQSLSEQRFVDCQKALGLNVLKVSIDLPGHSEDQRTGEPGGLKTWRYRIDHQEDIIAATVKRATAVLDCFVAAGPRSRASRGLRNLPRWIHGVSLGGRRQAP